MTLGRLFLESDLAGLGRLTFEFHNWGRSCVCELYPARPGVGATGRAALEDLLRLLRVIR